MTGRFIINSLKSRRPPALCKIVVEQPEACAQHGLAAASGSIGKSQTGSNLLVIVMRYAANQRNAHSLQREVSRVLRLAAAGCRKQTENGLIAQAVVQSQMRRHSPRILR